MGAGRLRNLKRNNIKKDYRLRLTKVEHDLIKDKRNKDNNNILVIGDLHEPFCLDESKTDTGLFGINIHRATGRAGGKSTRVDKWSAGCQVIASNEDWEEFIFACYKAEAIWGNKFTYTLINSEDIYGDI